MSNQLKSTSASALTDCFAKNTVDHADFVRDVTNNYGAHNAAEAVCSMEKYAARKLKQEIR